MIENMMIEKNFILLDKYGSFKPQINLARSTASRMWLVNLCAFMAVFQSSLTDSYSSLLVALCAVSAAVLTEFLILGRNAGKRALMDGSAVASALILTLLLPNRIAPFYAAAGSCFAMAIIKHSFGGLGSNWLNPAAGGWLFIRFSWPAAFTKALSGSPISNLPDGINVAFSDINAVLASPSQMDGILASFLNRTILSLTDVELPAGYMDLFASRFPGIIADRGVFALLIGTLIITASAVNRSWIPALYLAVFGILVRFLGGLPYGAEIWGGDVLFSLCTGGTLVAAFFLAADPATGAKSKRGVLLTTLIAGAMAFFFRYFGNEPYGIVLTAVFINAILPIIRVLESSRLYRKQRAPS